MHPHHLAEEIEEEIYWLETALSIQQYGRFDALYLRGKLSACR
jgi:hypothetical protein